MKLSWKTLLVLFGGAAWSQFRTAEISGVVADPSGAPIAEAAVTLRNEATGQVKSHATDVTGRYTGLDLLAGKSTVDVSRAGFKEPRTNRSRSRDQRSHRGERDPRDRRSDRED